MIHFFSGKPRSGKSLITAWRGLENLCLPEFEQRDGQRVPLRKLIVGNFPWHLDAVQDYVDSQGVDCHVLDWVTDLDMEQSKEFFLYRGRDLVLPALNGSDQPDYSLVLPHVPGVMYVLDEVHLLFNSREWKGLGPRVIYYASQHAKMGPGDNIFLVTQFVGNVDKQFRVLAQDFTYMRNERIERIGAFKRGSGFVAKTYMSIPGANDQAAYSERFKFPAAVAKCYDTSKGIGMPGGSSADKGKVIKGLSYAKILAIGLIALVVVLAAALVWINAAGKKHLSKVKAQEAASVVLNGGAQRPDTEPQRSAGSQAGGSPSLGGRGEGAEVSLGVRRWVKYEEGCLILEDGTVIPASRVVSVGDSVATVRGSRGDEYLSRKDFDQTPVK